jgi:hypothetical protein
VTERLIYHRLETPSQTAETALRQIDSQQIWGSAARGGMWSNIPKVKAYSRTLPLSDDRVTKRRGIEFKTTVTPDPNTKPGGIVYWSGERTGVRTDADGYAKIEVEIWFCNQVEPEYRAKDYIADD